MPRPRELPDRARVVVIGGGVGGTSIAYHLAQLGERDVILVDRDELTSGSTFHSAGLVGQLRSSVSLTTMMMYSVELYRSLDCGWVECGGIRLACTPEREQEVHRQVAWARTFGLPLETISAEEAREQFPLMVTDGVRVASSLPTDGYLDPSQLTYALADGARGGGVQIFTHTRVTGIDTRDGRVVGVRTGWGDVECERVVIAGGMYAAELGRMAGVRIPIVPMAHEYLVTQPFRDRDPDPAHPRHLPTLRDPDHLIYFREEGAGLVMGGYERHCAPWSLDDNLVDRIPPDFAREAAGQSLDCRLGDLVDREVGHAEMPADRAEVDDRPLACGAHRRDDGLGGEELVPQVDRDPFVPIGRGNILELVAIIIGGVVDEDVAAAELLYQ